MSKENGGPAFPIPGLEHDSDFNGMTLRDYFAAKASEEDIQEQKHRIPEGQVIRTDDLGNKYASRGIPISWRQIARYMHADAMLAERSKP